ncbi:MAG: hypothetical protein V4707_06315 [Pseudomonadota bacterium]
MQPVSHDPRTVAAASLGQVALVASARPDTFPNLVALAEHQPMTVTVAVIAVAGVSLLLSRLSAKPALRLRKGVLALIAISLIVLAVDLLNFVQADQPPWSLILYGMTGLILVGGLASLIVKLRNRPE